MPIPEAEHEDFRQILVQLRRTRTRLQNKLAAIPKSERSTTDQRDLDECNEEIRRYESLLESQPVSFRFINRERELTRLVSPTAANYISIEAPAGYGKSVLLQRMHEHFNSNANTLSLIATLSIDDENALRIRFAAPKDFIAYDGSLGGEESVESLIRHAVMPGISEFILLIDDMQLLVKDSAATNSLWRDLIEVLDRRLAGMVNFRVIFAGRRVRTPWQGVLRNGLQTMELEPFSERAVSEAVDTFLFTNYDRKMQQHSLNLLSVNISDLTGGHPQAIFQIIRELAEVGFALDYNQESDKYVFRDAEKRRFSQTYCVPALEEVFEGVPPDVKAAMHALSIVRGFNANIISHFISEGLIQWDGSPLGLLTALSHDTWLVSRPTQGAPLYRDSIVRLLSASVLRTLQPDRYIHISLRAKEMLQSWVTGIGLPVGRESAKDQLQVIFAIEAIYHTIDIARTSLDAAGNLLAALKEQVALYRKCLSSRDGQVDDLRLMFAEGLARDTEIWSTLGRILPIEALEDLNEFIARAVDELSE